MPSKIKNLNLKQKDTITINGNLSVKIIPEIKKSESEDNNAKDTISMTPALIENNTNLINLQNSFIILPMVCLIWVEHISQPSEGCALSIEL